MAEPVTVVTDVLLAGTALVLAHRLQGSATPLPSSRKLWAASFQLTAAAATLGGVRHALDAGTAAVARGQLWLATYLVLGLASLAFLAGLARASLPPAARRAAIALLVGRAAVSSILLACVPEARVVVADSALSLVLILGFGLGFLFQERESALWLLAGAVLSALGAGLQSQRLGHLAFLDHNDVFHLVQMAGLWLFYRAFLRLGDR